MSIRRPTTPHDYGATILGPVVAEFCLRLWTLGEMLERPEDASFLFCARGGLRMQLAYERFLLSSGLPSAVRVSPLMVSRVVAMTPALMRTVEESLDHVVDAAASTLRHEFSELSLADTARAVAGVGPLGEHPRWRAATTADGFARLLHDPDGAAVVAALRVNAGLFERHLREVMGHRSQAILVDTGLHGTTGLLLDEGLPDLRISSALMAHYFPVTRPERAPRTFGLSLEADGYSPLRPRSVMLRYWHLLEWLFEPALPSVRCFTEEDGQVRSDLEVDGWQQRVEAEPGSAFAGVMSYLDSLGAGPGERVLLDADQAWDRLHAAVVFPRASDAVALAVTDRTHDFGRDDNFNARPWTGAVGVLRGAAIWREGEVARAATSLRWPLLALIEGVHGARSARRLLRRARARASR